jgi:hypothetical protein
VEKVVNSLNVQISNELIVFETSVIYSLDERRYYDKKPNFAMPIYSNKFWKSIDYTTRKSEKTNGITDKIFSSKFFTDGHNSVSKSVGIYRPYHRRTIQFFWKVATVR